MALHTSADALITCAYWDELCDEDGFLALGRNRYHCSYVVYTDGTYIYAENGSTGNLDYGGPNNLGGVSGTNASAVIQAAITATSAIGGGLVFAKSGYYYLTSMITIPDRVSLYGEGDATRFLRQFNGTQMFLISTVSGEGQTLRDFMVDGVWGTYTGIGILVNAPRNLLLENLKIMYCESYGIHVYGVYSVHIKECTIQYCGYGVYKSDVGGSLIVDRCVIRFCVLHCVYLNGGNAHKIIFNVLEKSTGDTGCGVKIDQGDGILILGNDLEDFPTNGRCIFINGTAATCNGTLINKNTMTEDYRNIELNVATNTLISENVIGGTGTGLRLGAVVDGVHMFANEISATTPLSILGGAVNYHFWRNFGLITENQGAGEVIAAAVTNVVVAHGCDITPTAAEISVTLTNLPTNDIGDVYLSAIGAANFTINCRNVPGVATAIFSWAVRRI